MLLSHLSGKIFLNLWKSFHFVGSVDKNKLQRYLDYVIQGLHGTEKM